jgi:hypothetical protein
LFKQDDYFKNYSSFISSENFEKTIENNIIQIKELALDYMLESKATKNQEYVQILLKLCIDHKPFLLNNEEFYSNLPISTVMENIQILQDHHLYHSVALINSFSNRIENALSIWKE